MSKINFSYKAIDDLNEIKLYYEELEEYNIATKTMKFILFVFYIKRKINLKIE